MTDYEKPKRDDLANDETMVEVMRQFHLRLFVYLMVPAVALGIIFALPAMLASNGPDILDRECTALQGDSGIRITSITRGTNITSYYWTNNRGEDWHLIESLEKPYQIARVYCSMVTFTPDGISLTIGSETVMISKNGEILR